MDLEELIKKYFLEGYTQFEIKKLLNKKHHIIVSISTIKRRLQSLNLRRKLVSESDLVDIVTAIIKEMFLSGMNLGYKSMWDRLKFI